MTTTGTWPMVAWDLMALLRQRDHWINVHGAVVPLSDIDGGYADNILRLMRRNAEVWKQAVDMWYATTPGPNGDMASMAFDDECGRQWDMSAKEWLEGRPLYQAIEAITWRES